jgi:nitroreductase
VRGGLPAPDAVTTIEEALLSRRSCGGSRADEAAGRADHHRRNYDFFGAPAGIILTASRRPLQSALVDAGLFLQALMLAARGAGLHSAPAEPPAHAARAHGILRDLLRLT